MRCRPSHLLPDRHPVPLAVARPGEFRHGQDLIIFGDRPQHMPHGTGPQLPVRDGRHHHRKRMGGEANHGGLAQRERPAQQIGGVLERHPVFPHAIQVDGAQVVLLPVHDAFLPGLQKFHQAHPRHFRHEDLSFTVHVVHHPIQA